MPRYKVEVRDVLMIQRTAVITLNAPDEDAAGERAIDYATMHAHEIDWDEEQVGAEPYEAHVLEEDTK